MIDNLMSIGRLKFQFKLNLDLMNLKKFKSLA